MAKPSSDSQAIDRRAKPRPIAMPPGFNLKLDVLVKPIVSGLTHPWRGLFLLGLLIVLSIFWVWWTIENRLQAFAAYEQAVRQEFALSQELRDLERRRYADKIHRTSTRIDEVSRRILPSDVALAAWIP